MRREGGKGGEREVRREVRKRRKEGRRDLQSCWKSKQQQFLSILPVAQVNKLVIQ